MQKFLAFTFAACLVQGAFLAPVIARLKGANRRATRLLAALTLCFLPMIGEEFIGVAGLADQYPHSLGSSATMDFLIAPLLLLYAWTLTDPARAFTRRDLLQGIPFGIATLILAPYYSLSGADKLALLDVGLPTSLSFVIVMKIVLGTVYLGLVIRHLHRVLNAPGATRDPQVVWFRRAMFALVAVGCASVAIAIAASAGVDLPIDSDAIGTLFLGASIYMICFILIRHPVVNNVGRPAGEPEVVQLSFRPKYGTSPLTAAQKEKHARRLVQLMDSDRPFRDMQLSLEKLAAALHLAPGHLSQVLNEQLGMNFYEFVNEYRVRDVMARIGSGHDGSKTILTLAYESGFNSKASFNRAFKRVTGVTPTEYARRGFAEVAGPSNGGGPTRRRELTL